LKPFFPASSCVTGIARGSSQYGAIKDYGPQFAIDTTITNFLSSGSFFSSKYESKPWLEIAFPKDIKISRVKITNR
jgi:hypothetical protein